MDRPSTEEWMPHVWQGAGFFAWIRLLAEHHFAVHPRLVYVAAIATLVSFCHSVLWLIQEMFFGHRLRRTRLPNDPVFILGHWRSGTTHLHELLIRDPRHASPNTYQCFEPHHFLLTEKLFSRWLPFLMPSRRPMDDMPAGWDRPQEDEFALCMLGQPSPYLHIAFPNQPARHLDYLDFRGVPAAARRRWAMALAGFLRRVAYLHPGQRLILKSPPHSARIPTLLKQFPRARFIHIVRNPYQVYPSTIRLWKTLYKHHALQEPNHHGLEAFVLESGRRLYEALEMGKGLLSPGRFVEVRYEDLIADPERSMAEIYRSLELGDFVAAWPRMQEYLVSSKSFRANRHQFNHEAIAAVAREWGDVIQRYGYQPPERATPAPATNSPPAAPHLASTP